MQTSPEGRAACLDRHHPHPLAQAGAIARPDSFKADPNHRVGNPAGGNQLAGNFSGPIDRNGKAQPSARTGAHQGVDADHLPLRIEQGPPGVPRIDRRIGLNQIEPFVGDAELAGIAVEVADDAHRHRVIESVGIAHGDRPLAHLQAVGIAQGRHGPGP